MNEDERPKLYERLRAGLKEGLVTIEHFDEATKVEELETAWGGTAFNIEGARWRLVSRKAEETSEGWEMVYGFSGPGYCRSMRYCSVREVETLKKNGLFELDSTDARVKFETDVTGHTPGI